MTGDSQGLRLSGSPSDPTRGPVEAPIDPRTNLPTSIMRRHIGHLQRNEVKTCIATVHEANINLDEPSKELLRWHYKLGHIAYKKVQFLMRSGVLSTSLAQRQLHKRCCSMKKYPKCASCQYAKQTLRSSPGNTKVRVQDHRQDILRADHVHPGQCISLDHFVTSTKGRLFSSRGRTNYKNLYTGGCIFVDHASGYVYVEF